MSGSELAVGLADALAWPFVVAIALIVLRRPLRSLLGHVEEITWPGGSVKIREGTQLVTNDLENATAAADEIAAASQQVEAQSPTDWRWVPVHAAVDEARNAQNFRRSLNKLRAMRPHDGSDRSDQKLWVVQVRQILELHVGRILTALNEDLSYLPLGESTFSAAGMRDLGVPESLVEVIMDLRARARQVEQDEVALDATGAATYGDAVTTAFGALGQWALPQLEARLAELTPEANA